MTWTVWKSSCLTDRSGTLKTKNVIIDSDKMREIMKERGITIKQLSEMTGLSASIISHMNTKPERPESTERLLCFALGLNAGDLIKQEQKQEEPARVEATVMLNLVKQIADLQTELTGLREKIEKELVTHRKLTEKIKDMIIVESEEHDKQNSMHVTLARINENLLTLCKSPAEKAEEFIKSILKNGKVNVEDVYAKSDIAQIKRADLITAKKRLNVQSAVTGYGKNAKTWWFLESEE